jgi:biotin carboxyl carrier protein
VKYIVTLDGREIEVEIDGEQVTVEGRTRVGVLTPIAGTPMRQLMLDGAPSALAIVPAGGGRWLVTRRGERWEVDVQDERTRHIRSLTGSGAQAGGPGALKAPMPGLVVRVQVESGQHVTAGAGVVVLEAMKMENELRATVAGVVRSVRVQPGEAVDRGQVLVEFDPAP